ncbi:MAG TPA: hypothetical protein VMW16_17125 [Sedimentisphaerales bacterium]|nr:hypothetical protein [Sedimentisphaerales bacterium]
MDGICDVKGCNRATYMGWRPLTERLGRQICEYHWRRHLDKQDSFDLFDEFGFRRPAGIRKPMLITSTEKKQVHHGRNVLKPVKAKGSGCKACGAERGPGHTYCPKCSRERKTQSNRLRQKRHYLKAAKT